MKTLTYTATAWLLAAGVAGAQEPAPTPGTRADVQFVMGWQNLHKAQPQPYGNDWLNALFYGGAGAGWYWTDHLKTQVDFGAGTQGHQYRYQPIVVNGQTTGASSRLNVRQQGLSVAQHYQFFRNEMFHPHVGAGVEIARETTTEEHSPILVFDNVRRIPLEIRPARTEGPDHRLIARPFAEAGFKAYVSQRAFFTGDTRIMLRKSVDEVLFRFGFGVDF